MPTVHELQSWSTVIGTMMSKTTLADCLSGLEDLEGIPELLTDIADEEDRIERERRSQAVAGDLDVVIDKLGSCAQAKTNLERIARGLMTTGPDVYGNSHFTINTGSEAIQAALIIGGAIVIAKLLR